MKATQELVTPDLVRKITERIVAAYQPQQIILFGSCAYGQPDEDSDIDLLVGMESTLRPVERARQLSDLFPDRRFGIDILVRTPQEIAHRLAVGDEFLSDIIERGKVLYERRISHRMGRQSGNGLRKRARPRAASRATSARQGSVRLRAMR